MRICWQIKLNFSEWKLNQLFRYASSSKKGSRVCIVSYCIINWQQLEMHFDENWFLQNLLLCINNKESAYSHCKCVKIISLFIPRQINGVERKFIFTCTDAINSISPFDSKEKGFLCLHWTHVSKILCC